MLRVLCGTQCHSTRVMPRTSNAHWIRCAAVLVTRPRPCTTHGLVVQALFDPRTFPHHRQVVLLDAFLESLARR